VGVAPLSNLGRATLSAACIGFTFDGTSTSFHARSAARSALRPESPVTFDAVNWAYGFLALNVSCSLAARLAAEGGIADNFPNVEPGTNATGSVATSYLPRTHDAVLGGRLGRGYRRRGGSRDLGGCTGGGFGRGTGTVRGVRSGGLARAGRRNTSGRRACGFGAHLLLETLGAGGSVVLHLNRHIKLARPVALTAGDGTITPVKPLVLAVNGARVGVAVLPFFEVGGASLATTLSRENDVAVAGMNARTALLGAVAPRAPVAHPAVAKFDCGHESGFGRRVRSGVPRGHGRGRGSRDARGGYAVTTVGGDSRSAAALSTFRPAISGLELAFIAENTFATILVATVQAKLSRGAIHAAVVFLIGLERCLDVTTGYASGVNFDAAVA
jgi:hypothetical protein